MDRKQLEEIAQTIVERFNPVRVILISKESVETSLYRLSQEEPGA